MMRPKGAICWPTDGLYNAQAAELKAAAWFLAINPHRTRYQFVMACADLARYVWRAVATELPERGLRASFVVLESMVSWGRVSPC